MMMGFITNISSTKCDVCHKSFSSGATGDSSPYNDYSCVKCNWTGTVCNSCGKKPCVKCGNKIQSTYEKSGVNIMY